MLPPLEELSVAHVPLSVFPKHYDPREILVPDPPYEMLLAYGSVRFRTAAPTLSHTAISKAS